ncbi:hypothetical protein PGIGA_G00212800 [Pangasianodon gigas]|uniref:Uncharacterized protein n=1 Tax=Pangasianodon gigas TaxID=30993 RepID=A0ACC5WGH9_PANGG|nr:hypothetical protein [Pangasianodon gigas]
MSSVMQFLQSSVRSAHTPATSCQQSASHRNISAGAGTETLASADTALVERLAVKQSEGRKFGTHRHAHTSRTKLHRLRKRRGGPVRAVGDRRAPPSCGARSASTSPRRTRSQSCTSKLGTSAPTSTSVRAGSGVSRMARTFSRKSCMHCKKVSGSESERNDSASRSARCCSSSAERSWLISGSKVCMTASFRVSKSERISLRLCSSARSSLSKYSATRSTSREAICSAFFFAPSSASRQESTSAPFQLSTARCSSSKATFSRSYASSSAQNLCPLCSPVVAQKPQMSFRSVAQKMLRGCPL